MPKLPDHHNETVAVYRGRTFLSSLAPDDPKESNVLLTLLGEGPGDLTGFRQIAPGIKRYKRVVKRNQLDALYVDRMYFQWRGQRFLVNQILGDGKEISGSQIDLNTRWARENGLTGNQYDGFTGVFPIREIEDLHVVRTNMFTGETQRIEVDG